MKNKLFRCSLIWIFYLFFTSSFADELNINALELHVDKEKKIIYAEGEVEISDTKQNLILTEKVEYDKSRNLAKTLGQTNIITSEKFKVTGKNIFYDNQKKIIYSNDDTVISDKDGNKIFVNMFNYLTEKNMFLSKGSIKILDTRNNEYFFSEIYIDEKKRKIVGSDIKGFFDDGGLKNNKDNQPRLFANSATISDDDVIFEKGIFTTCKNRGEGKCPPWTIKAKQIKHDKTKKTIYYDNAVVEIYDFPIFYFPKFFHPGPSVKRQSGFLVPKLVDNSNIGFSASVPYFWAMSKNHDMTITPKLYAGENILVMNEYRHAFKNAFLILDTSYTKGYKNTTNTNLSGSRSHFFSKLFYDFAKDEDYTSILQVNLQHVSNDTYLKVHDIDTELVKADQNILKNEINYEFQNENNFLGVSASAFEDITKKDRTKYEYVLPNLVFERNVFTDEKLGMVDIHSNAFAKNYNVNQTTKMLVNDFSWKSNMFTNFKGLESKFEGLFKIVNYEADNADRYKTEGFNAEVSSALAYKAKFPLVKKNISKNKINFLTPKLSLRYAPGHMRNIQNDNLRLSYGNLFSINKNSQVDVIEKGVSAIYGVEISNNDFDGNVSGKKNYSLSLGQIYNVEENTSMPSRSSLDQKASDLVGEAYLKLTDNLTLKNSFSVDHNFNDINYNDLQANLMLGNTNFNISYLEENNHIGNGNYVKSDVKIELNNSTQLSFDFKKNLETHSTEFYNLSYNYLNDCLKAGLVFRREFYSDRDIRASDSLMFQISLLPFGGVPVPLIDR
jgi:LPS-assembly protein